MLFCTEGLPGRFITYRMLAAFELASFWITHNYNWYAHVIRKQCCQMYDNMIIVPDNFGPEKVKNDRNFWKTTIFYQLMISLSSHPWIYLWFNTRASVAKCTIIRQLYDNFGPEKVKNDRSFWKTIILTGQTIFLPC